jgi:formylglycine-generating enzyme required for sulfatase activity
MSNGSLLFLAASLLAMALSAWVAQAETADQFTIRADWFDRGNVRASPPGQDYADKYACIWNAGQLPNQAEYEIDFPVTAEYTLVALYTANDSRPVDIYLDDVKIHRGFAGVTGSWQTSRARWETQCKLRITQGRHTVKLLCPGPCMPHICALRFESPVAFPAGWRLARRAERRPATIEPVVPRAHYLLSQAAVDPAATLEVQVLPGVEAIDDAGPAARDELLRDPAVSWLPPTPWAARVTLRRPGREPQWDIVPLDPARVRKTLDHVQWLLDDYRVTDVPAQSPGVATPGLGTAIFSPITASTLLRELSASLDRVLAEPEGKPKWERFWEIYLAAAQLEARVVLANPLLDFDQLLVVRRSTTSPALGLPQNWQSNCALPTSGFDNEIAVFQPVRPGGRWKTLYRPKAPVFVGDVDLHFDADKLLFSSVGSHGRWQVFEIRVDGTGLRQVTLGDQPDVNNYDPCYLPDGRILFCSTASMVAVPCVNGSTLVANLYRMDADGRNVRQLCFDQEHNWCPTVMPNGRVLYLRWEYTDTPHAHDRVLFTMNPDGTGQMEHYGSNSYWPNSMFYARPIPGRPTMFAAIVSGHHGVPRMGELVLFDVARGRREAEGAVQRIPERGKKVEAIIADNLVDNSWPKFLHPYPLSDKYLLVAAQQTPHSPWGIYLVDVADGMFLLAEEPGQALLEPIPLKKTPRPPVLPDKIDPQRRDAIVYLQDVYAGEGLRGVPRGAVKQLRLFTYHFLYPGMGGPQGVVGMEGPWDIKRILGTVPVEPDGSAVFRVPANTPIAVQPLDEEGKALQLMRSWFTGMPGEVVSCVGCHEGQNSGPPVKNTLAARKRPAEITPWYGPERGFNFAREVQPVLDRYCVGCHNGVSGFDLRGQEKISDYTSLFHHGGVDAGHFSTSYAELHRYVRRPGLESDYHMLVPMEFHADTTRLVQLLRQGHYGVQLDREAWDRLITWIDLNAPYHGTWTEIAGEARVKPFAQRRRELLKLYAGVDSDPEAIPSRPREPVVPLVPRYEPPPPDGLVCEGWPFDPSEAQRRQAALGQISWSVPLGDGLTLDLVRIPPGSFIMGENFGPPDERPRTVVAIRKPFWIGRCEVTNEQFARFDPAHDSRVESKHAMQFGVRGFYVNGPKQPVVRVSWRQAMAFCEWLSRTTGKRFCLPTEAQWEYACRAGSATPFWYGDLNADFSRCANLADLTLREFVCDPYNKHRSPFANPGKYDDWIPKDDRFHDGGFVSEDVGRYRPNPWGLIDMHGNVAEWTRSAYWPYPYREDDGRNDVSAEADRVVRGGSWRDKPLAARSASRLPYRSYQPVYNVGFRVVCEE